MLLFISGSSSHVPQIPTAALNIPKSSEVRVKPSFGTRKSGNNKRSDECADIIESENARNEVLKIEFVL